MLKFSFKKIIAMLLSFTFLLSFIPNNIYANERISINSSLENFTISKLSQSNVSPGKDNVSVEWNPLQFNASNGTTPTTRYYVARRKIDNNDPLNITGDYDWELRGNYEPEQIKVLNVYPKVGNGFQLWMEELQRAFPQIKLKIQTTQVSLETFNDRPQEYLLKNSDGTYYYDVVVFGFWDSNNYMDISKTTDGNNRPVSAYDMMQSYIDAGYSVIFGHDTVQYESNNSANPNFQKLLTNNSNIVLTPSKDSAWAYSDKIAIAKQSTFTTYPFDIVGQDLIIPISHTVNQYPSNPYNVYMTFEKNYYPSANDGPYYNYNIRGTKDQSTYTYNGTTYMSNAYLIVDNNIALIQAGHSSGKTSTAEQAVLANTIYALSQMHKSTKAVDLLLDTNKPTAPIPKSESNKISFESTDIGTTYKYRIIAEPVGYGSSVSKNWDFIKSKLDVAPSTPTMLSISDSVYALSDTKTTNQVFADINNKLSYEYYIDKNSIGERRDENSGTKFVEYGSLYDINSLATGLGKDQYLHLWAHDNVNNISVNNTKNDVGDTTTDNGLKYTIKNGITNVNLWTTTQNVDATVNYKDNNNTEIMSSETISVKVGSVFSPETAYIEGYRYNRSEPSFKLTATSNPDENIITQYYDKIITKNVYIDKDDKDPYLYATIKGVEGDEINAQPPACNFYDFIGYYDKDGNNLGAKPTTLTEDDLYLKYVHQTGIVNVVVKDTKSRELAKHEYNDSGQGYRLGEYANIDLNYTKDDVANLDCYTNSSILDKTEKVYISKKNNTHTVTLIPRTKKIIYYGVDFSQTPPQIQTNETTKTFSVDKIINFDTPEFDGWTPFKNNSYTIDFSTSDQSIILIGYYKDELPSLIDEYTYTANYYSVLGNTTLLDPVTGQSVTIDTDVFYELDDYELDYVELTYLKNGDNISYKFGNNQILPFYELPNYLPELDSDNNSNNEYTLNIYYRPYCTVTYTEFLTDTNATTSNYKDTSKDVGGHKYTVLYEDTINIAPNTYSENEYELMGVWENDSESNINLNSVSADELSKTIEVYYRPKSYDLEVQVVDGSKIDLSSATYTIYTFKEIPINEEISFIAPISKNDYELTDVVSGNLDTDESYIKWTSSSGDIGFDPQLNENKENAPYIVQLIYKHTAQAQVTYAIVSHGNVEEIVDSKVISTYVGNNYEITIPSSKDYEIVYAYLDGELYEPSENETFSIRISKPYEHLYVVYKFRANYVVNSSVSPTNGGVVYGNTDNGTPIKFSKGDKVYLDATANEGYSFVDWTISPSNIVIDNTTIETDLLKISTLIFTMPDQDVTVKANFTLNDNSGGNGGGSGGGGGGGGGRPTKPITPITPIKPTIPNIDLPNVDNLPDTIDELMDILNGLDRKLMPYIQGYPNSTVRPNGDITRSEVVTIIYNLYGSGYEANQTVLSNFSDVEKDYWYSNAIAFSYEIGAITGYADGTFRPNTPITRAELASILSKFAMHNNLGIISTELSDINETWAKESINHLISEGIISGYPDGTFKPNKTATRAEFVKMVNKLIDRPLNYAENITYKDLPKTHWGYDDIMNASNGSIYYDEYLEYKQYLIEQMKNK